MARLLVDVKLEVLVVVHEAAADLVDGEVEGVLGEGSNMLVVAVVMMVTSWSTRWE